MFGDGRTIPKGPFKECAKFWSDISIGKFIHVQDSLMVFVNCDLLKIANSEFIKLEMCIVNIVCQP